MLLSDVYDDISIDDAPYYSALYGPARSALVVLDLEGAIERLKKLEDCPEDIYLIQGNPDSFDEDLVEADELGMPCWCAPASVRCASPATPSCRCLVVPPGKTDRAARP